jgi:hypothetical protein
LPESLLNRKELIIVACFALFSVLWMVLFIPFLSGSVWFQAQVPPIQFVLYEVGFMVGFVAVLGVPISYIVQKYVRKKSNLPSLVLDALKIGLSAWLGISIVYDLLEPPFFLSQSGAVLLNNPNALTGTAIDATLAWCWQQVGLSGSLLYYAVYLVTPILIILVIALVLTWRKFIKLLGHS